MTEVTSSDVTELKSRQHAMWAASDYASIAERIWVVGERAVSHARVESGDQVLDVAAAPETPRSGPPTPAGTWLGWI